MRMNKLLRTDLDRTNCTFLMCMVSGSFLGFSIINLPSLVSVALHTVKLEKKASSPPSMRSGAVYIIILIFQVQEW